MFDINGKVALITGGARGIGLAIAKELLWNGLRAVAIMDINEALGCETLKEIQQEFRDRKAIFLNYDVSIKSQFEAAFKAVVEEFKNLDIVINGAGVFVERDWENMVAVNLLGSINGSLLALEDYLPHHKSGDEAVILNFSSLSGVLSCYSCPAYSATKYGILSLTCALGHPMHYERKKVKVMAICPGATATELYADINRGAPNEDYIKLHEEFVTDFFNIIQTPEDVAKAAVHIIKNGGSGSIWMADNGNSPYEVEYVAMKNIRRYN